MTMSGGRMRGRKRKKEQKKVETTSWYAHGKLPRYGKKEQSVAQTDKRCALMEMNEDGENWK